MTNPERIDYLIKELASNNAKYFAQKCGINVTSMSKVRKGSLGITRYVDRILSAYPEVRREWLVEGKGKPFLGEKVRTRSSDEKILKRLDALEKKMDELIAMVEEIANS